MGVVAGLNYFVRVQVSDNEEVRCVDMKIHLPIRCYELCAKVLEVKLLRKDDFKGLGVTKDLPPQCGWSMEFVPDRASEAISNAEDQHTHQASEGISDAEDQHTRGNALDIPRETSLTKHTERA